MTDMIERVAQTIFAKDPESLFTIHQARVYARAAIAAMREPTKDMAEDGMVALHDKFQTGFLCCGVYRAMIDAALEDE
jgi:hypothetical protein